MPSANTTPAITSRISSDPFRHRHFFDALSVSLNTMVRQAKRLPLPLVLSVRSRTVAKTLRSAVANAEHEQRVDVDALYVKQAWVDEGPTAKRFLPRAHGRATPLFRRTSHITIVVDEREHK